MKSIVLLVLSLCGLTLGLFRVDPLVSTKVGLIRGLRDNGFAKFLGVPYGKINESNVFGAAIPHTGFEGIFEAYDDSNTCARIDHELGGFQGTADCLTLNILVPDTANSNNRLPVMVWIHGGGFVDKYPLDLDTPVPLLKNEVIVVTVNYRLGVYGFMCLDIPEVPGNAGLKDQVLALRWVKENIEAFGGDANQITVFGESAGSISINLHLFSPNEILFHRAILQSGTANLYDLIGESETTVPFRLAEELGFNTTDIYEALSYLSEVNPQTLSKVAYDLNIANGDAETVVRSCVEQRFDGVENVITDYSINIKSTKVSTIPIIIGYNSNENAFRLENVAPEYFDSYSFRERVEAGFDMNDDLEEGLEIIKQFYIGDEEYSVNVISEITDFESDFMFLSPTQRMAHQLLENGAKNIYQYVFSYEGNEKNVANKPYSGAAHGDELSYLFGLEQSTQEDLLVTDRIAKLWTNFAKYGDPTPDTSELLPVKWSPITKTSVPYLDIDLELNLKNRPFRERMAFWNLFYKQYGKYQKWYKSAGKL